MNKALLFDFIVDKEKKEIRVERAFNAPLDMVWEAWTNPQLLDQWWAPKPFKTETKSMDFRVGGHWLYTMNGPNGECFWCKNEYTEVNPKSTYAGLDGFCFENGEFNKDMPMHDWRNTFESKDDQTVVHVKVNYSSVEELNQIIEMGFKEGFTAALENLDELLKSM
ncbi:MAG: SRPBCC domain-containing protein [Bacteroidetes bacterium]|nr:SRPBCC domain-containing protein [Bacteroidota bacterium]